MNSSMQSTRQPWIGFFLFLLFYVFFNLTFQGVSLFFGYRRHFLGAEMLLATFFFISGRKWLGSITLLAALVLELALGMSSLFYLFEKNQLWDMLGFLFQARPTYLIALLMLPVLGFSAVWVAVRIQQGLNRNRPKAVLAQSLIALGLFQGQWVISAEADTFFAPTLSDRQHLLFGSTAHFIREVMKMNRLYVIGDRSDEHAEYFPIKQPSATQKIWGAHPPSSDRILLVVAEGWGLPTEHQVLEWQIEALRSSPHVQALRIDAIGAKGATAAGELRELCRVVPTRMNFRKMTPQAVGDCLPAQLRRQGYATVGIHGAYGGMYRRTLWWPQVGFSKTLFKENIPLTQEPCYSFPGHCDRHLLDTVKNNLTSEKAFVYWLSLNSHMPYDRRDVELYSTKNCSVLPVEEYGEQLCDYQNLHAQFFRGLANLAKDDRMKGVEVLVVGDHPPLFNDESSRSLFVRDQVPLLHFFVK